MGSSKTDLVTLVVNNIVDICRHRLTPNFALLIVNMVDVIQNYSIIKVRLEKGGYSESV